MLSGGACKNLTLKFVALSRFRHLPHPLKAHVLGTASRNNWPQEIRFENEPQEALLIEPWVNLAFDFLVLLRQFAPVDTGRHVVRRVVAVVWQSEVQAPTREVAGVIDGRLLIGVDMLYVVENQYAEQGNLLWDDDVPDGLAPVNQQGNHEDANHAEHLQHVEPKLPTVLLPERNHVLENGLLLLYAAERRIGDKGEQVVFFRHLIGAGIVFLLVDVNVVVGVVGGYPAKNRKAIEHRQPVVGEDVHPFVLPHGQVLVVVNQHGNHDGHVQLKDVERDKCRCAQLTAVYPKINEKDRGEEHEKNGTDIGVVSQHNYFFYTRFCDFFFLLTVREHKETVIFWRSWTF